MKSSFTIVQIIKKIRKNAETKIMINICYIYIYIILLRRLMKTNVSFFGERWGREVMKWRIEFLEYSLLPCIHRFDHDLTEHIRWLTEILHINQIAIMLNKYSINNNNNNRTWSLWLTMNPTLFLYDYYLFHFILFNRSFIPQ